MFKFQTCILRFTVGSSVRINDRGEILADFILWKQVQHFSRDIVAKLRKYFNNALSKGYLLDFLGGLIENPDSVDDDMTHPISTARSHNDSFNFADLDEHTITARSNAESMSNLADITQELMPPPPARTPSTSNKYLPSAESQPTLPTKRVVQLSRGAGPKIPPLALPQQLQQQSPLKPTRSTRRFANPPVTPISLLSSGRLATATDRPPEAPKETLLNLATRVGEACMLPCHMQCCNSAP